MAAAFVKSSLHCKKENIEYGTPLKLNTFKLKGGSKFCCKQLISEIPDILVLSAPGIANILLFRDHIVQHMQVVSDDEDDLNETSESAAKRIRDESKQLKQDQSSYDASINLDDSLCNCSPTLLELLSKVSPKLSATLPAAMISNMVTLVNSKPTALHIGMGITLREKNLIDTLYKFGVSCSYEEILRFKSSATHAASQNIELLGIKSGSRLVQIIADNFDEDISSPNRL